MIRNSDFVESILNNLEYGKKAQVGYDVTLKQVKRIISAGKVGLDSTEPPKLETINSNENGYLYLPNGTYSLTFNEGGEIPMGYAGFFHQRSSLARNGAYIFSGVYDPAFQCGNFGAMLVVTNVFGIFIEQNARVAQLLLIKAEDSEAYNGQWQGDKDKK